MISSRTSSTKKEQHSEARRATGCDSRVAAAGPGAGGATGVFLGTNAKSKNRAEKVDPETGEITGYTPVFTAMDSRVKRFVLQSVVRSLFPKSRIDKCLRLRQKGKEIQVLKSVEHKTASGGWAVVQLYLDEIKGKGVKNE